MNSQSISINYSGIRPFMEEAVAMTNRLLRNETFYRNIARHPGFDLADISPEDIAELMRSAALKMEVELYYAISPVKNIDGYDDPDHPNIIHLNVWQLDRPITSICNSLVHGCVHAVNHLYPHFYFGHGDYGATGKRNTAPYAIGAIAEDLLTEGQKTSFRNLEHDETYATQFSLNDFTFAEGFAAALA